MNIKLSICIPTYNRAAYLTTTLESIVSQASENIEIVVSDNASQDTTEGVVQDFIKRFPNITYYRWPENAGADRNYLKVAELARGDYCWFMGSDDLAKPESVARVLTEIVEHEPDILLSNRDYCNIDMQKCIRNWWHKNHHDQLVMTTDKSALVDYLKGCQSIGGVFSYLSSIVVRRSLWNRYAVPEHYVGTAYSHVYPLLSGMRDGAKLRFIADSLVLCRGGNDSFLSGNRARRMLLDYKGYRLLADDIFGTSAEAAVLYGILSREHRLLRIVRMGFESSAEDWQSLYPYLVGLYPHAVLRFIKLFRDSALKYFMRALIRAARGGKWSILNRIRR